MIPIFLLGVLSYFFYTIGTVNRAWARLKLFFPAVLGPSLEGEKFWIRVTGCVEQGIALGSCTSRTIFVYVFGNLFIVERGEKVYIL